MGGGGVTAGQITFLEGKKFELRMWCHYLLVSLPTCYLLRSGVLFGFYFDSEDEDEDGGDMFFRNVGWLLTDYMKRTNLFSTTAVRLSDEK
jgi:hypothetical protein